MPGSRRHLTRLGTVWKDNPVYFITTGTVERRKCLADPLVHTNLREEWLGAETRYRWLVGRYVILPDHVHFFCCQLEETTPLERFLASWKQYTAKRLNAHWGTTGSLWQKEFFDHVLRSEESYESKWEYVRQNPVRHKLVEHPEDWPYQGEIHPL